MYISTKHQTDICTRLTLGLAGYADFAWIGGNIPEARARRRTRQVILVTSTGPARGNAMLTKPSEIADEDIPRPRILTEEGSRLMRENLAQKNFGMSFAEFAKAWNTGEFAYDRERHGKVLALAMMLPEYWED